MTTTEKPTYLSDDLCEQQRWYFENVEGAPSEMEVDGISSSMFGNGAIRWAFQIIPIVDDEEEGDYWDAPWDCSDDSLILDCIEMGIDPDSITVDRDLRF